MLEKTDPMNMFHSRKTAKIVKDEVKDTEWTHQLRFCKWLKQSYPDILYRSDIQAQGKASFNMQNIKQILDPYSGWPDITIFSLKLMIEMKKPGASLAGEHFRNQKAMHDKLSAMGWHIYVCFGFEEAKLIVEKYLNA